MASIGHSRRFCTLLNTDQISSLAQTHPGWTFTADKKHIEKKYEFADFKQAWMFMNGVALYADAKDHHPEWFNVYNRVEVQLSTHTANGVTEKDLDLASYMDNCASSLK